MKNVFTGLYGTISMPKDFSLDVSFIVGRNYFKNNRNINLPGLSLVANESHKGLNLSSRFKVGTTFNLKKVEVSPYVGFGYLRSTENGYTETNAGSLNLSVLSKRNQFLQAETGVNFSKDFLVNEVAWNPNASIGLSRDQAYNLKSKVTSSFVGETNNFVIDGNNSKKNQVSTNLSLAVVFKSGAYVNVGYSAKFNRSEQTHEAVIRIGKKF